MRPWKHDAKSLIWKGGLRFCILRYYVMLAAGKFISKQELLSLTWLDVINLSFAISKVFAG